MVDSVSDNWPFIPTNDRGEWDFDRVTDFDLQPLYVPAEGLMRRDAIDWMIRGSEASESAFDLASREAVASDDLTAFVLDRAPRLLRLAQALADPELSAGHMPAIVFEARLIVAAIEADVRSYGGRASG